MSSPKVSQEVAAIRAEIERGLNQKDDQNRIIGNCQYGIYAFFDYDGEPVYVGQTKEKLRTRIRRHLTNQRTDAVAMNVLDPFEVLDVEMWPFWELSDRRFNKDEKKEQLNKAEYTVFQHVLAQSSLKAMLNEKDILPTATIALPPSYRFRIVPPEIYAFRKHPDIRIARRAGTIANLARVISERQVSLGLRRTLLTQARRLEYLASKRLFEFPQIYMSENTEEADQESDEET